MDSNGSKANNLTIEGLDAAYGAVRVIEGVSLNVRSGEVIRVYVEREGQITFTDLVFR